MSAAAKTVRVRRYASDPASEVEVTLTEVSTGSDSWTVQHGDRVLGEVGSYEGSLDRPTYGGRLRRPGKRRTLWWCSRPGAGRVSGEASRASAIRWLLYAAGSDS